ncbi:MAG: hypothetical protein HOE90_02030 [Bacteriovoracaceae bacterium]|jgi:hypothetical protein|nr:hypothetical protein [Bacteriovoracaceae bacterium]
MEKVFKNFKTTLIILYFCLLASRVALYLYMPTMYPDGISNAPFDSGNMIVMVILGIVIFNAALCFYLYKIGYQKEFLTKQGGFLFGARNSHLSPLTDGRMTDSDKLKWIALNKFQIVSVTSWALSESIFVFGLISPNLGANTGTVQAVMIFSTIIGCLQYPRLARVEEILDSIS